MKTRSKSAAWAALVFAAALPLAAGTVSLAETVTVTLVRWPYT